jgi:hypothetical protein
MPGINFIRTEIEQMRSQVRRQRSEIRQLQRARIPTSSAEALLDRMLNKIDTLCAERDRLKSEQSDPTKEARFWAVGAGDMREPLASNFL